MTTDIRMNQAPHNSAILLGASGNIGSVLLKHMKREGWSVTGTYARRPKPGLIRCDLTEANPLEDLDLREYRYGIILIAACNIDQCKRDPEMAAKVNVEGMKRLLAALTEKDVHPAFFSSDYVYDGRKGSYTETDPRSPNTEYGRQKAAMETYIQENHPQALIVRISKVFSAEPSDNTLLSQWHRMIRGEETIRNASDQRTCPTYDGDITAGLLQLLDRGASGLFNLCQPRSYTRGELLAEFLNTLDIRYANVEEWETWQFGFLDERPANVSLNPAKFLEFTGYEFTPMQEVFHKFQRNLKGPVI